MSNSFNIHQSPEKSPNKKIKLMNMDPEEIVTKKAKRKFTDVSSRNAMEIVDEEDD